MGQYGLNWRQLRDQPDHKGTIVYFDKPDGYTQIGQVTKDLIAPGVLAQIAYEAPVTGQWDFDNGTKPDLIQHGTFNFNRFLGVEDTALYIEMVTPSAYEPTLPLKFGVYYRMDAGTDATKLRLNFDYLFFKEGDATPSAGDYTLNPFDLTPTADEDLHIAINAEIPAQPTLNARDAYSLRFVRNAVSDVADVNQDGFCLLSMFVYQEAIV